MSTPVFRKRTASSRAMRSICESALCRRTKGDAGGTSGAAVATGAVVAAGGGVQVEGAAPALPVLPDGAPRVPARELQHGAGVRDRRHLRLARGPGRLVLALFRPARARPPMALPQRRRDLPPHRRRPL